LEEEWGCFKHIGMSWDMIMRLPIHERRELIRKHNRDVEMENNRINNPNGTDIRTYEGESLNTFAKMEQQNKNRGH
jgi:hypothetical protein